MQQKDANRRAVILGASGAVGGHVLAELLRSPAFSAVTSIGRRTISVAGGAEKLTQHVVDLEAPASYADLVAGHDVAICTLGVGEPSKLPREAVWKVDVDYVVGFAGACRERGVRHFSLMTAVGADARSRAHYLKMKGVLEERVIALGFPRTSLFRPSMLLTPTNRYGATQAIVLAVWPKLHWLLAGPLRRFRGITVADLGRAIARECEQEGAGVGVHAWDEFQALAPRDR